MTLLRAAVILLTLLAFTACESGNAIPEDEGSVGNGLYRDVPVVLPFLEDVTFPNEILEGEPFMLHARVSAAGHPTLLRRWNHAPALSSPVFGDDGAFVGVEIYIWLSGAADAEEYGPIVDSYAFEIPGLPAGSYSLWAESAESRELGGLVGGRFQLTPNSGPLPAENVARVEYKFVVQPSS